MQVSPFLNLKVHVNFKNSVSDIYMHAWLQVQYDQGTWAFEYNSKLKVLWIADIGPGNLRPYGRDRGNLKKLPLTHGEATNKRTTFSIMLWLKKSLLKALCGVFPRRDVEVSNWVIHYWLILDQSWKAQVMALHLTKCPAWIRTLLWVHTQMSRSSSPAFTLIFTLKEQVVIASISTLKSSTITEPL